MNNLQINLNTRPFCIFKHKIKVSTLSLAALLCIIHLKAQITLSHPAKQRLVSCLNEVWSRWRDSSAHTDASCSFYTLSFRHSGKSTVTQCDSGKHCTWSTSCNLFVFSWGTFIISHPTQKQVIVNDRPSSPSFDLQVSRTDRKKSHVFIWCWFISKVLWRIPTSSSWSFDNTNYQQIFS